MQERKSAAVLILVCLSLSLAFSLPPRMRAQQAAVPPPNEQRAPLSFRDAQPVSYELALNAGQTVHLAVQHTGLPLKAELLSPTGTPLTAVTEPDGHFSATQLWFTAETSGRYQLRLTPTTNPAQPIKGQVEIRALRSATTEDTQRITAQHLMQQANQLRTQSAVTEKRKAVAAYREALALWLATHETERAAVTRYSLGRCLDDLGDKEEAQRLYHQALPELRAANNRTILARLLGRLGIISSNAGDSQAAEGQLQEALKLGQTLGHAELEAEIHNGLGIFYFNAGDEQKSLAHYLKAYDLSQALHNDAMLNLLLNNIGGTYLSLGEFRQALDYLQRSAQMSEARNNTRLLAQTVTNIGVVYERMGEQQKALTQALRGLELSRSTGQAQAETLANMMLGKIYQQRQDHARSLAHLHDALKLARRIKHRYKEVETLLYLGQTYYAQAAFSHARNYVQDSLNLSRAGNFRFWEYAALYELARLDYARGDLAKAQQTVETALDVLETLRAQIVAQELRLSFLDSVHEAYEFYVSLLMEQERRRPGQGYAARALQAAEKTRARSLIELLTTSRTEVQQGVSSDLLKREQASQQALSAAIERRIAVSQDTENPGELQQLDHEISRLRTETQRLETELRQQAPQYAALFKPQPLAIAALQQFLDDDSLLLEYSLGEQKSYLWAVSKTSLTSYELPGRKIIETAAERWYEQLRQRPSTSGSAILKTGGEEIAAGAALSELILKPVAAQLRGQRLLVVGDGALHYLPFSALPTPSAPDQTPPTKVRLVNKRRVVSRSLPLPLLAKHEIIQLPSASVLSLWQTQPQASANQSLAILADPVFGRYDDRLSAALRKPADNSALTNVADQDLNNLERALEAGKRGEAILLTRLPFSRDEADAIAQTIQPAQLLLATGFDANRELALSPQLRQFRIIHFATHGFFHSERPDLSGLFFSTVNEEGETRNGFVGLDEIYNLDLPAELVVLSACETALGQQIRGEGLIGLTRGFMHAGAKRVVASLWKVNDAATAELMKRFYQAMLGERRLTPAAALRAAQLSLWKEPKWRAPYFWASFVMQGKH